jgi:hypothetical protein
MFRPITAILTHSEFDLNSFETTHTTHEVQTCSLMNVIEFLANMLNIDKCHKIDFDITKTDGELMAKFTFVNSATQCATFGQLKVVF